MASRTGVRPNPTRSINRPSETTAPGAWNSRRSASLVVVALLGLRRRRPRRERKTGGDDVLGETTVMPAAGIPGEPAPGRHQKGGDG